MATFSFLNFNATITGPGGIVSLGNGSGAAEEGISFDYTEEADDMKIGADGTPMHTLNPGKGAKVTVRMLKTSPTNAQLEAMYNLQRLAASTWGQNVIVGTDLYTTDVYTGQKVAFAKFPKNDYAKVAGMIEWVFNVGILDVSLGTAN